MIHHASLPVLNLSEDDYKKFQEELLKDPRAGSVIPGLGGLRKIRLGFSGKGTRGGLRIDYLDISRMPAFAGHLPQKR